MRGRPRRLAATHGKRSPQRDSTPRGRHSSRRSPAPHEPSSFAASVLVVTADPRFRRQLAQVLTARGHGVRFCADTEGALAESIERAPDLALVDWSFAPSAVARLSGIIDQRPGLVLALVADDAAARAALRAGADDFIVRGSQRSRLEARLAIVEARLAERASMEQERQLLGGLMEHFPGHIYFKDRESRFVRISRALAEHFGLRDPSEALGRTDFDIFTAEHAVQARADEQRIVETGAPLLEIEEKETWPDGRETWVSSSKLPLLDREGRIVGTFGISVDVTQRKQAQAALRRSEERYALAVQGANDGIWDWDLATGRVYYSTRWKAMLGYDEAAVGSSPDEWLSRVHPEDVGRLREQIAAAIEGLDPHLEIEHRIRHCDGRYRWVLARGFAVRDARGTAYRMAGAQTDVTERRAQDPLTGLANRSLFIERLEMAMARARRRRDYLYAALFIDLDHFKAINDTLGHLAGDRVLLALAKRLQRCVRPEDLVARFGGDEFAVLLDGMADPSRATRVAERILSSLSQRNDVGAHKIELSASIGIALSTTGYEKAEDVLRDADTAMYRAKELGRARWEVFDEAMRGRVTALLRLESDVRRGFEQQEFRLHYQPLVSLRDGRLLGFEALLRWPHAQRGLVMPSQFVPAAEDSALIVRLGYWVLAEAMRQLRSWQDEFPGTERLSVAVNCSVRQLTQPDFVRLFSRILQQSGLDAACVHLEMTEQALTEGSDTFSDAFRELQGMAVQLHLDDFGTGNSSLSHLRRFHLDKLKIDRSFVSGGPGGPDLPMVRSVLALAQNHGIGVIAEGLETAEQVAMLALLGCHEGQGSFFSWPVDAETAGGFIERRTPWVLPPAAG